MAKITSNGAVSSTTRPSSSDVRSTMPAITRYASRAPTARVSTSVSAPNWSESPPATLSTSPVGTRWGSTCPIWVVFRVTSFIEPYIAISQERTTIVWPMTPAVTPSRASPSRPAAYRQTADESPPRMPSSMI